MCVLGEVLCIWGEVLCILGEVLCIWETLCAIPLLHFLLRGRPIRDANENKTVGTQLAKVKESLICPSRQVSPCFWKSHEPPQVARSGTCS